MVELQQEMGIQVSFWNNWSAFKSVAQVSNQQQQQQRQQPRNGVQQLLQAQQVSISTSWNLSPSTAEKQG